MAIKFSMTILCPDSFDFLSIRPAVKPVRTIKGTFPSIITPRRSLTGFRNSRSFNPERILRRRKKSVTATVFRIDSRQNRYVNAETRYPQPISPRIPHQPVIKDPSFSG